MDVTMDIEVEHQITQPESQLTVMETCCEEPALEESYMTEEVQMRSQAQKQGQQHQGSQQKWDRRTSREIKITTSQVMNQATSLSTIKGTTKVMVTNLHTRDNSSLH